MKSELDEAKARTLAADKAVDETRFARSIAVKLKLELDPDELQERLWVPGRGASSAEAIQWR